MTSTPPNSADLYHYTPSHVAPAVFAGLIGLSFVLHIYQNFHYRFWRVTFFMFWGGAVFTSGWILRVFSSYNHRYSKGGDQTPLNLYIAQNVLILAGPPIYSAAEYNILGRLMHYLPMHAPLHPHRVVTVFIYLGAAVESLTAAGASKIAANPGDRAAYKSGSTLLSASLVLQAIVECIFMTVVATVQYRAAKSQTNLPRSIRTICIMLYCTSILILFRCVFRAIESFSIIPINSGTGDCTGICNIALRHEWYLYVFEAAPMMVYTYWLNIVHPGKYLPQKRQVYLDEDGQTERLGPGWIDRRSRWETFADPLDFGGMIKGQPSHEKFWEQPEKWSVVRRLGSTGKEGEGAERQAFLERS